VNELGEPPKGGRVNPPSPGIVESAEPCSRLGKSETERHGPLAYAAALLSHRPPSRPALPGAWHRGSLLRALRLNSHLVDVETRARLSSVSDLCEQERQRLEALGDPRLEAVLLAISRLQAEVIAALATLGPPPRKGR
jgi:hypothetical protein